MGPKRPQEPLLAPYENPARMVLRKTDLWPNVASARRTAHHTPHQVATMQDARGTSDLAQRLKPAIMTLRIIVVALVTGVVAFGVVAIVIRMQQAAAPANGAAELLSGERETCAEGYVIDDPHEVDRLAWALLQLLDADRRAVCAAAARRNAAAWTFERHYQRLLAILADAAMGARKFRAA